MTSTTRPALRAAGAAALAGSLLLSGCADDATDGDATAAEETTQAAEDAGDEAAAEDESGASGGDEAQDPEDVDEGSVEAVVEAEPTVTVEEFVSSPEDYVGQTVVVEGFVGAALGGAFSLAQDEDGAPAGPDEGILVVGAPGDLESGLAVTVAGTVEDDFQPDSLPAGQDIDLDPIRIYEGQPWVDASAVEIESAQG